MGKRQQKPERELKTYIVVIDFARYYDLKLYGVGIIEKGALQALRFFKIDYLGDMPSKKRRKKIPLVRQQLRGIDRCLDLYVSRDVKRTLNIVESILNMERSTLL